MKEVIGDIWERGDADSICVTTNGIVKKNGELVMGKGIALQAKQHYPDLPLRLGRLVRDLGNTAHLVVMNNCRNIFSFPTKHHYKDKSDIKLIEQSAHKLVEWTDAMQLKKVYLTRPGCGSGGLKWADVKKVIEPILDDRFTVIAND